MLVPVTFEYTVLPGTLSFTFLMLALLSPFLIKAPQYKPAYAIRKQVVAGGRAKLELLDEKVVGSPSISINCIDIVSLTLLLFTTLLVPRVLFPITNMSPFTC